MAVITSYPLQFVNHDNIEPKDEIDVLERKWSTPSTSNRDIKAGSKKLQDYCAKIGFVMIPDTECMIRPVRLLD